MRAVRGVDTFFLVEERPQAPMHTLKLVTLDRAPSLDAVRAQVAERIGAIEPLRLIVAGPPHQPVWVDRGPPDLDWHVVERHVPAPGGPGELRAAMSELAAELLDRRRPLWRMVLLRGVRDGGAVILQVHHALAGGPATPLLLGALLGGQAAGGPGPEPEPLPDRQALRRSRAAERRALARSLPGWCARSVRAARHGRAVTAAGGPTAARAFAGPALPWSGPLEPSRAFATVTLELEAVRRVRAATQATAADVITALISDAVSAHLAARGPSPRLSVMIPIALATGPRQWPWGNRNVIVTVWASPDPDPVVRLRALRTAIAAGRARRGGEAGAALLGWWNLYRFATRGYGAIVAAMGRLGRPPYGLVVSTVVAPPGPLRLGGAEVREIHSLSTLTDNMGLNVTAWTVGERVCIGVVACGSLAAVAEDVARRCGPALERLSAPLR